MFRPGTRVLDLGAAPGSWSLYILRKFNGKAAVTAVDLSPFSREYDRGLFDKATMIRGDITAPDIKEKIRNYGPFDVVLSDAAPATTGNAMVDAARSFILAEIALEYAQNMLVRGGNCVIKVFQSEESSALLRAIRTRFTRGIGFKPEACRSESFETYYIGIGFSTFNEKPD